LYATLNPAPTPTPTKSPVYPGIALIALAAVGFLALARKE